jgi:hypothetical protein
MRPRSAAAYLVSTCIALSLPATSAMAQSASEATPEPAVEAHANESEKLDKPPAWETAKPEHRGGFAVGVGVGVGVGASDGYPNDSAKIGRPAFHQNGGTGFGLGSTIWIGGALSDWLSFGLGFGYSNILASGTSSGAPYGSFHTDIYPLYGLGGTGARRVFRDLGALFEFGLGFPKTLRTKDDATLIDGAGSSYLFGGIAWEGISAWKLRMGPYVGVHYMFSDSIRRPLGLAGFRLTLYSAP